MELLLCFPRPYFVFEILCARRNSMMNAQAFPQSVRDKKMLVVGCGNSELSEKMCKDGFRDVLSIDTSESAIQQMSARAPRFNTAQTSCRCCRCRCFLSSSCLRAESIGACRLLCKEAAAVCVRVRVRRRCPATAVQHHRAVPPMRFVAWHEPELSRRKLFPLLFLWRAFVSEHTS